MLNKTCFITLLLTNLSKLIMYWIVHCKGKVSLLLKGVLKPLQMTTLL